MVVDTRPQRGIKEKGNQMVFGKQGYGTLLPVQMSPTTKYFPAAIDSAITVRNDHPNHVSESKGNLSAPPSLGCMCSSG